MAAFCVCQAAPIITLSGQHLCHLNNGGASSVLDFGHIRLSPQTFRVGKGGLYVSGVLRLLLVKEGLLNFVQENIFASTFLFLYTSITGAVVNINDSIKYFNSRLLA